MAIVALGACTAGSAPAPVAAPIDETCAPARVNSAAIGPAFVPRPAPYVGGPDFTRVYENVGPSVVGVVAGRVDAASGDFEGERLGSGFAWDASGHIVTNDHILGDADSVRVRAADGQVYPAQITGRDPRTDVAVLHVAGGLWRPASRLADTDSGVRVGMWVAAIGNPYGMEQSITVGVVSAKGRRHLPEGAPRYRNFIQTDASINPGNSGGPLVDGQGRVVALTTAILGRGQGLSFATPIDMVATVVGDLLEHGRFIRGFAGLYTKPVGLEAATRAGLDRRRGARIRGIVQDGPADRAGFDLGDIILRYGDAPVDDPSVLPWYIAATEPGETIRIRIARGDRRLDVDLTVAAAPE